MARWLKEHPTNTLADFHGSQKYHERLCGKYFFNPSDIGK